MALCIIMLYRSRLNLLLRQPSVSPLPAEDARVAHDWTRSYTISEGVGLPQGAPTLEIPLAQSEILLTQSGGRECGRTGVGVAGVGPVGVGVAGEEPAGVGVAGERPAGVSVAEEEPTGVGVAGAEPTGVAGEPEVGEAGEPEVGVAGAEPGHATVGHVMLSREKSVSDEVRNSPGFKFLTREDLYKFAKVWSGGLCTQGSSCSQPN